MIDYTPQILKRGTSGSDRIAGKLYDEMILGGNGGDILIDGFGRGLDGGDDTLKGGRGDDMLFSNGGRDKLLGNRGDDFIFVNHNLDDATTTKVNGGRGDDTLIIAGDESAAIITHDGERTIVELGEMTIVYWNIEHIAWQHEI